MIYTMYSPYNPYKSQNNWITVYEKSSQVYDKNTAQFPVVIVDWRLIRHHGNVMLPLNEKRASYDTNMFLICSSTWIWIEMSIINNLVVTSFVVIAFKNWKQNIQPDPLFGMLCGVV